MLKVRFGHGDGVCALRQQDQLGFDAQEFGDPPTLLVMFGFGERRVDRCERLSDVSRRGQTLRERAEHDRVIRDEAYLPKLVERSTKHLESLIHLAALDESDSVVAPSRSMPGGERVSCRI